MFRLFLLVFFMDLIVFFLYFIVDILETFCYTKFIPTLNYPYKNENGTPLLLSYTLFKLD